MRKSITGFKAAVVVIMTVAIPLLVRADSNRTWVSGVGDDVNPCTRTAPCRTFAYTISVTPVGGEITVLDPGDFRAVPPVSLVDFGPVTIKKSITINGNSIAEIIPGNNENGVTISV